MIRPAALAALLLAAAQAWAGPQFILAPGLDAAGQAASRHLLDDVAHRLPPAWLEALPAAVTLEWRDDLPAQVHGRAVGSRVLLDRHLLRQWQQAQSVAGGEPVAARPAQAALIHELAHLYDRSAAGRLSADPRLLDLAGWQKAVLRPGRRARNDFRDRSPDRYELEGPREFVAVNLEHYLLDPGYACQRPALAAYFDARFGRQSSGAACALALPFVQDASDGRAPVLRIDPARVWAVDYLFAEANGQPMSRWGHSMLRLVVCAPGRRPGPECRLDLQHHLVLSFRAFVEDLQISGWRGLSGRYPSRLFALPLDQVVDEYTRVELRGLRSLPLALSPEEVAAVVERAAQLHWSYDGRYYFLSNNCAVETWRLLHDAVPRLAALPLASITPSGLMRRLQRAGVVDARQLPVALDAQVRQGFRFESAAAHQQAMYAVARQALDLRSPDALHWLQLDPLQRRPALEQAGLRAAAALLVLESAALRREQAGARDLLKRRWLGDPRHLLAQAPGLDAALEGYLDHGGAFARPAGWLEGAGGYGIPQEAALALVAARASAAGRQRLEDARALEAGLRGLLPPQQRQRLQAAEANLELLSRRLRELAENADGAPAAPRPE